MSPLALPAMRSAVTRTSPGCTVPAFGEAPGWAAKVALGNGGGAPPMSVFGKSDWSGALVANTGGGALGVRSGLAIGVAVGAALGIGLGAGVLAATAANGSARTTERTAAHVLPAPGVR